MPRTYSNTPEPRYVEKAKSVDGGGGGISYFHVTIDNTDADNLAVTLAESYNDLLAAVRAGHDVRIIASLEAGTTQNNILLLTGFTDGEGYTEICFNNSTEIVVRSTRTDLTQISVLFEDGTPEAYIIETSLTNYA